MEDNIKKKKVKKKKVSTDKEQNKKLTSIAFNILAIFCIAIFCFAITPKSFQNDTFYTIAVGQGIREYGIDGQDHFSMHDLPYTYPHWLYDVIMSLIYDFLGGFTGLYISTVILSIILGLLLYFTLKKITKNQLVSFAIALGQMYIMKDYVAARAHV